MDAIEQRSNNGGKMLGGITGKGFLPGKSGNPHGRPEGTGLTDKIRAALAAPDDEHGTKGDRLIALAVAHAEKGDFRFFKELIDRHDGPLATKAEISGPDGVPVSIYKCVKGDWPEKV